MRVLDLFCGAGIGADGYIAAGFGVIGVDINPQPHYPGPFHHGDALDVLTNGGRDFDLVHASPPCQLFTRAKHLRDAQGSESKETLDLLTPTIDLLRTHFYDTPWVVENVPGTKQIMQPQDGEYLVQLCGSSFGLGVQRHRLFLTNFPVPDLPCNHASFEPDPETGRPRPWGVYHVPGDSIPSGGRTARNVEHGKQVMGVHRDVTWDELKEGFPPAYTEHIARHVEP